MLEEKKKKKGAPGGGGGAFLCKIYETYLVGFDSYMLVKI